MIFYRVRLRSPRWQTRLNMCRRSWGLRRRGEREGEMERKISKEMSHAYEADAGVLLGARGRRPANRIACAGLWLQQVCLFYSRNLTLVLCPARPRLSLALLGTMLWIPCATRYLLTSDIGLPETNFQLDELTRSVVLPDAGVLHERTGIVVTIVQPACGRTDGLHVVHVLRKGVPKHQRGLGRWAWLVELGICSCSTPAFCICMATLASG